MRCGGRTVRRLQCSLAGTVFLLEEVTHRFHAKVWVAAFVSAIAADAVTFPFFGTQPCLYLPIKTGLPTGAYPWLIVLGVAIGALAFLFQYFIFNLKWWYRSCLITTTASCPFCWSSQSACGTRTFSGVATTSLCT